MDEYKVIALTHKNSGLDNIGKFHIESENRKEKLAIIKKSFGFDEFMYLSTCNRVEFLVVTDKVIDEEVLRDLIKEFIPQDNDEVINSIIDKVNVYFGKDAIEHTINVASSLDSMVIGEREIITQVKESFNNCKEWGLTGDKIRLLIHHTTKIAKRIFSETKICNKPVSVVSLAYKKLSEFGIGDRSSIIMLGAGQTNTNMAKFLMKHELNNFHIFNRTYNKAKKLANKLSGYADNLEKLSKVNEDFDAIITCTGSSEPILTQETYNSLLNGDTKKKIIIDLALPH
ncbi:MAG: glutamyl-tRNA reductase, partial [Flavobacteriales bacterium]